MTSRNLVILAQILVQELPRTRQTSLVFPKNSGKFGDCARILVQTAHRSGNVGMPVSLCGLGISSTSDSKRPNVSFRPPTEQERAGAKVGATVESERFTATEDALRRAVDTTPALIHTGRPDGYLDYFNRGWLDFLGKSLEDVCDWPEA